MQNHPLNCSSASSVPINAPKNLFFTNSITKKIIWSHEDLADLKHSPKVNQAIVQLFPLTSSNDSVTINSPLLNQWNPFQGLSLQYNSKIT